jgi:purine-nucleoside phosphorylase
VTDPPRLPPILRLGHPVCDRAVLVGDPGRALALARTVLEAPLMSNHARGLWGYTGTATDGRPLSVLSTGTGGPSAATVLRELHGAGVRRVVRAGSAAAIGPSVPVGGIRVVRFAAAHDGTSRALGRSDGDEVLPEGELTARLEARGLAGVGVVSVDLLPADGGPPVPVHPGADAVDRQTAPLLAAAERLGMPAAAVVGFPEVGEDDDARAAWWQAVGVAAAGALGG